MKAVVYDRYGGPDVLRLEEVARPTPTAGQVLVEIAATSINLSDNALAHVGEGRALDKGRRHPALSLDPRACPYPRL